MKNLVLVRAPCDTFSGYGFRSLDIIKSLMRIYDWDIKIWSVNWGNCQFGMLAAGGAENQPIIDRIITDGQLPRRPDIFISITVPNEFQPIGRWNCGISAGLECTIIDNSWISGINRMDLNLVSSTHSKNVFTKTEYQQTDKVTGQQTGILKCEKPVDVLFEGVDTNIYKKVSSVPPVLADQMKVVKESFAFLFVGHWLNGDLGHDRKDVGMLIKVFFDTFKNMSRAPALILKTSGATFSIIDREEILKKISQIRASVTANTLPNVYLLHGDLTAEEMNALYNHPKVKAHITFAKGEGYNRPMLEASMSEKPIMASNWSGHTDFLNKSFTTLLPGTLGKVHKSAQWKGVITKDAQWFTVDYQYASKVMMDMYKHLKKYAFNAKKQAIYAKSIFRMEKMDVLIKQLIDKYIPAMPEEKSIQLPKLKRVKKPIELELPPLKKQTKMKLPKLKRVT